MSDVSRGVASLVVQHKKLKRDCHKNHHGEQHHAIISTMLCKNAGRNTVYPRYDAMTSKRGSLTSMTIAVCPGSYDPVTAGHMDVIERCASFFEEVHVVVAVNAAKTPMFSESTRVQVIREALDNDGFTNVKVASTTGLITDYCKQVGATVIVKGLRQNGDYEAELGMALVNRKLANVETLFLPADPVLEHISSSIVKDVARHGGNVSGMVPDKVVPMLAKILQEEKSRL